MASAPQHLLAAKVSRKDATWHQSITKKKILKERIFPRLSTCAPTTVNIMKCTTQTPYVHINSIMQALDHLLDQDGHGDDGGPFLGASLTCVACHCVLLFAAARETSLR